MALRLNERYKINHLCSDGYRAYSKFNFANNHHTTKSETCLVEAKNSSLRDNLARLNRQTKRYSKSATMLYNTVLLFVYKDLLGIN